MLSIISRLIADKAFDVFFKDGATYNKKIKKEEKEEKIEFFNKVGSRVKIAMKKYLKSKNINSDFLELFSKDIDYIVNHGKSLQKLKTVSKLIDEISEVNSKIEFDGVFNDTRKIKVTEILFEIEKNIGFCGESELDLAIKKIKKDSSKRFFLLLLCAFLCFFAILLSIFFSYLFWAIVVCMLLNKILKRNKIRKVSIEIFHKNYPQIYLRDKKNGEIGV